MTLVYLIIGKVGETKENVNLFKLVVGKSFETRHATVNIHNLQKAFARLRCLNKNIVGFNYLRSDQLVILTFTCRHVSLVRTA